MFRRKTLTPAVMSSASLSSLSQAGPTVATILVCESRGRDVGRSGMVLVPWSYGQFTHGRQNSNRARSEGRTRSRASPAHRVEFDPMMGSTRYAIWPHLHICNHPSLVSAALFLVW